MRTQRLLRRSRSAHLGLSSRSVALAAGWAASAALDATRGFQRHPGRERAGESDRDAVCPRRPSVRCRAGRRLRVIKNGTLLPTPFLTAHRQLGWRTRPARRRLRPGLCHQQFVYVYYTATTPAIHNRISRFTANGDVAVAGSEVILLELDNLSSATNHNGGALALWSRRQALRGRRRERQWRERADARRTCTARCSASIPTARSRPTIRSTAPTSGEEPRHLGARPAQPLHFRLQSGALADVHQRRRAEYVGRDQRRRGRRQLRLAHHRGRDDEPELRQPAVRVQPLLERRLRDYGRCVLLAVDAAVSLGLPERLFLRRLLRRLDSEARPFGREQHRHLRHRHRLSRRSQGGP